MSVTEDGVNLRYSATASFLCVCVCAHARTRMHVNTISMHVTLTFFTSTEYIKNLHHSFQV